MSTGSYGCSLTHPTVQLKFLLIRNSRFVKKEYSSLLYLRFSVHKKEVQYLTNPAIFGI